MKLAPLRIALVASGLAALTVACSAAPPSDPVKSTDEAMKCTNCGDDTGGGETSCATVPPPSNLAAYGCGYGDGYGFPCPAWIPNLTWTSCPFGYKEVSYVGTNFDDGCINARMKGAVIYEVGCINGSPTGCRGTCPY